MQFITVGYILAKFVISCLIHLLNSGSVLVNAPNCTIQNQ